jgi:hypothetical protein
MHLTCGVHLSVRKEKEKRRRSNGLGRLDWAALFRPDWAAMVRLFFFLFFLCCFFFSFFCFVISLYLLHFNTNSSQTKMESFLKLKRTIQNCEQHDYIIKPNFY